MIMRRAAWMASCLAFLFVAGLSHGQRKENEEVQGFLPATRLEGADFTRFGDLYNGREAVRESDKALLQKAAEWYVFRLTWAQYRNGTQENNNKSRMDELVRDCVRLVPAYNPSRPLDPTRKQFVQVFSKFLHVALEKVLKTEYPISHVNAAIILDHLAKTGFEEVADTLVQVLDDPKENDGTRLYALRGLHDLFALAFLEKPIVIKDKKREARSIEAIIRFLNRPADKILGQMPSDGEVDGFRWVRREAVMALGVTRYPWLEDAEHKKIGSPAAWELLRVACKNDHNPTPLVKEQVEAAVGLCQLKTKLTHGYQIDYAAYCLGWFIRDFAMQYAADQGAKSQPWKYHAARLLQALQAFKDDAAGNREDRAAADYVNKIYAKFAPVLQAVEEQKSPDTTDLKPWLLAKENQPAGKTSLFRDDPKYAIQPPSE